MENTQIFDVFNESLFNANVSEFEDEDGKYEIRTYSGQFLCTIGISTRINGNIDDGALNSLNRMQFPFKYSKKGDSLQCTTTVWVDRKPTKKAMSELVAIVTCNLKNAKEVVLHYREEDQL